MALFCAKSGQLQTVKGVFECKEMLREGVDYVRYQWLVGDGAAYIMEPSQTVIRWINYQNDFGTIKIFDATKHNGLFYEWIRPDDKWVKFYLKYINGSLRFAWHGGGYDINVNLADGNLLIKPRKLSSTQYNGTCVNNDVTYNIPDAWYLPGKYVPRNHKVSAPEGIGISKFEKVNTSTNEITRQMYPCRLLHSIPAILDGNGIARQAGECGMYDSVSGKFFGNVATSGSFTVTND